LSLADFNPDAREAALWTRDRIGTANGAWLKSLPALRVVDDFDLTLVHGSPVDPIWGYVLDRLAARAAFGSLGTRICLNGHTHVPLVFRESESGPGISEDGPRIDRPTRLGRGRLLINPGSVGQPRDGDPRAAFGILETEAMAFTHMRVAYDIAVTQHRMEAAKLPGGLIRRLGFGQ
jgi:diadenosine tetraphosphatase ApaH/serine/threonine PP2A family protein phosphatase